MRKIVIILVCMGLLVLPVIGFSATEAQKRTAIDNGLAWLASEQLATGAIGSSGQGIDYLISQTGSALLAFLEEKPNWGTNAAVYQAVVDKGLNYIFSQASIVSLAGQPAGNPDANGDGLGVKFYPGGANARDTYVTGLVLPAIASAGTPSAMVASGPLAGWTYQKVVQNTIDYFAYGQNDVEDGNNRGGWRYHANYNSSDQSTTQWPVIASLFATNMGVSTQQWVKNELALWTDYIQNDTFGCAGYTSPDYRYGEMNETGALLLMQDFLGWGTGDTRVQAALNYINTHWQETASSYDGNFGHPYAMWAIYKGLETTIGLDNNSWITNLHAQGSALLDPGDTWNWWEDYCQSLVSSQGGSGDWAGYSSWGQYLATAWNINILAATKIPGPPVPEPGTLVLTGVGLLALARIVRKRGRK